MIVNYTARRDRHPLIISHLGCTGSVDGGHRSGPYTRRKHRRESRTLARRVSIAKAADEPFTLFPGQRAGTHGGKASAGPQQSLVDIPDVREVGGEQDLASLGSDDSVRNGEKAMQIMVAAGPSGQQMIGVLDYKRVVRAGRAFTTVSARSYSSC